MTHYQELESKLNYQEKVNQINRMFQEMNIHTSDVLPSKEEKQTQMRVNQNNNFNSRGELMLSPKEVRENYDQAIYCFKWYQMPFCRRAIRRKINFWAPASVIMAWTYGEYTKKKDRTAQIKLPFKFYFKSFVFFFAVTSAYCVVESLLFDQFCDIESPFYQQNETRLSIAKRIQSQMKDESSGGIFNSLFK